MSPADLRLARHVWSNPQTRTAFLWLQYDGLGPQHAHQAIADTIAEFPRGCGADRLNWTAIHQEASIRLADRIEGLCRGADTGSITTNGVDFLDLATQFVTAAIGDPSQPLDEAQDDDDYPPF